MNALSILGKRFQDAGLQDLCIESGILVEGSVTQVMEGRMYNRAVRVHKIVFEALFRLMHGCFIQWLREDPVPMSALVTETEELVAHLHDNVDQTTLEDILKNPTFHKMHDLWQEFCHHLRYDNGDLSAFWMSYVDFVQDVLLGLLRPSREGNWDLHLFAIREMIPWCFAYDKLNYAMYLPVYYAEMTNLSTEHPEVYEAFRAGYFSVQLSARNAFGRLPVDQTTEVTVNKDTKTAGGTTRFSLKPGAVSRYYLITEYRSAFLTQLRDMVGLNQKDDEHSDLQKSRMATEEAAVAAVIETLSSWVNPFEVNRNVSSVSTGVEVPREVAADLKTAHEASEEAYKVFRIERLEPAQPVKKFHDPMHKLQLKTFASIKKKKATKA